MRFFTTSKSKMAKVVISSLLVCSFILAPISSTLQINRADAWDVVFDPVNWAENGITALSTAASALGIKSLVFKEFVLDTIAWGLINLILQQMIRSVTQWVNSGFQGSPAFVQDLGGFLTNIADRYAGDYIYGKGLSALCSPFKLNIKLALDLQYRKSRTGGYQSQCRLSGVVGNVQKFIGGDFIEGGWNGWYEVALNPKSNPYDTMLDAQAALSIGISGAQGKKLEILKMGNGFLSKEVCKPGSAASDFKQKCSIVTPGTVIQNALTDTLNIPNERLVIADELNELIGALFAQLASKILSGAGGLLGLTGGGGSNTDYFDQISSEATPTTYSGSETGNPLSGVLEQQKTYLGYQNEIIKLITDARSYKETRYGSSTCSTGELTQSLANKLSAASTSASAVTSLTASLQVYSTDFGLLRASSTPKATINTLLTKYGVATIVEAESKIMNQYSLLNTSGLIHSDEENIRLRLQTIPDLKEEINTFKSDIDNKCDVGSNRP